MLLIKIFVMKKCLTLFLIAVCLIVSFQCGSPDYLQEPISNINVPESSDHFGKSVALELELLVRDLHKKGVDYSQLNDADELYSKYCDDLYLIRPEIFETKSLENSLHGPDEFVYRINLLTDIQVKFINQIINECNNCSSYKELYERLAIINNEIRKDVPDIQQERLFNVTSFLYYSMKSIEKLESEGVIIPSPVVDNNRFITKSIGNNCRKVIKATWAAALCEPTPFGEAIFLATAVVIAGIVMYEIIVCKSDYSYCQYLFENCYSDIPDGCAICLQYCLNNGEWPPYGTHRCSFPEPTVD